jgi:hypothetical protein
MGNANKKLSRVRTIATERKCAGRFDNDVLGGP